MDVLKQLVDIANETADGHLTIMKFTTNWRIGFITPSSREASAAIEQARTR
jgi:hypothetical protein